MAAVLLTLALFALSTSLAEHDVVITTYSLVSKEIPVQKEEAEQPSQDTDPVVRYAIVEPHGQSIVILTG